MKFLSAALTALLSAEAILANPVTLVRRESTMQKRRALRKTSPLIRLPVSTDVFSDSSSNAATNESQVQYSSNWAGAVLIGSGYTSVVGTITVPTPKKGAGSSSSYAASAWVGIDGDTCSTAILQTGVDFTISGSSVSYDAWYEWYPDYAYTFSGFAIRAGDSVRMTATASSLSAGSVKIENLTTGKTVTHSFTGETNHLCETNAEWIVEDFEQNGALVPFANFGTVTFTGCSPSVSGAQILDIKQNNHVYTDCSTSGSSTVTCKYTP